MKNITRRSVIKAHTGLLLVDGAAHNIVCNCENEVDETAARRFPVDAGYRNFGQVADELTGGDVKAFAALLAPCAVDALDLTA